MAEQDNKEYSDVEYVYGVSKRNPVMERALHYHCKKYFDCSYKKVFFGDNNSMNLSVEAKQIIFQNAFVTLWENIMAEKISVENGVLLGKDKQPFSGKLTTYFMRIAYNKYHEWLRSLHPEEVGLEGLEPSVEGHGDDGDHPDDEDDNPTRKKKIEIYSDLLSQMKERQRQIITMFYGEGKTLEEIRKEFGYKNTNTVKNLKCRYFGKLQESANTNYEKYIESLKK